MRCEEYVKSASATNQRQQCAATATWSVHLTKRWPGEKSEVSVCTYHRKRVYPDLGARRLPPP